MAIFVSKNETVERATLLRELLLRRALRRPENPNRDYTAALDSLTDDLVVTDTNGVLTVDLRNALGEHDGCRHNIVAAARRIMAGLETAPNRTATKSDIVAHEAPRGFTAPMVNAALAWLVEQRLITVTNGVVTDISGDRRPSGARAALPDDLVTPRTVGTAAPQTVSTATTTEPSTTAAAARHRMDASDLTAHVPDDPMAFGRRLAAQSVAGDIPNLSFDPGDLSMAPPPVKQKVVEKTATKTPLSDGVLVAYTEALSASFGAKGKVSVPLTDIRFAVPTMELPGGWTVGSTATHIVTTSSMFRHENGVVTHVPAARAVGGITKWVELVAAKVPPETTVTVAQLAGRDDIRALIPSGWESEVIVTLALEAALTAGALVVVTDGVYLTPAAPEPEPEPVVEPAAPTQQPVKSGVPETSTTSAPVAPATTPSPSPSPSPSPKTAPKTSGTVAAASGQSSVDTPTKTAPKVSQPETAPVTIGETILAEVREMRRDVRAALAPVTAPRTDPQSAAQVLAASDVMTKKVVVRVVVCLHVYGEMTRSGLRKKMNSKRLYHLPEAIALGLRLGVLDANAQGGKALRLLDHSKVIATAELEQLAAEQRARDGDDDDSNGLIGGLAHAARTLTAAVS